ncbi:MAG: nuclear transport factor 2 family protein [Litorimonas sp.]
MDFPPPITPEDTVSAYVWTLDRKAFDDYAALFGDTVYIDYDPPGGLPSGERIPSSEWVDGARKTFSAIPVTHHSLVPVRVAVDGNEARVLANCVARHFDPEADGGATHFTQYMHYDVELLREDADARWTIDSVTARIVHQEGDPAILRGSE